MKKKVSLILPILMGITILSACNKTTTTSSQQSSSENATSSQSVTSTQSDVKVSSKEESSSQVVSSKKAIELTVEKLDNISNIVYIMDNIVAYQEKGGDSEKYGFMTMDMKNKTQQKYVGYQYCEQHGFFATFTDKEKNIYDDILIDTQTAKEGEKHYGHGGTMIVWNEENNKLSMMIDDSVTEVKSDFEVKDELNPVQDCKSVESGENAKFGYYNKDLQLAIPLQYCGATCFGKNGLAGVKNSEGKWGYIDKDNKVVLPFEYDMAYKNVEHWDAQEVYTSDNDYLILCKAGKYGVIKNSEVKNLIINFEYDNIIPTGENKFFAKQGEQWESIRVD